MRKIAWIFLLIFTASLSLYGCGNGSSQEKKIVLAWDFGITRPVWEKIAAEYMALNKDVTVTIDQKDGQTYPSWLAGQLSKANKDADIVVNSTVQQYFSTQFFVDYSEYVFRMNPYAGNEVWKDVLEPGAYAETPGARKGQIFNLNNQQVITGWFYNKDMFNSLNVEGQVGKPAEQWTWDDLIAACEIIKQAGKVPFAISGGYQSFWIMQFGWLFRTYTDQYFRDLAPEVMVVEGDYLYDEELQSTFIYDMEDPYNDSDEAFLWNDIRLARKVKDGELGPGHQKFQNMIANLSRLIPKYVPDGFTSIDLSEAGRMFVRGDAAIYLDLLSFYAGIERTFADVGSPPFEVGIFKYPPMTGDGVAVGYTRDMGGPAGAFGVIYKNKAQADLSVDFLQFFMSPRGQTIFLAEMEKENIAPQGVSLVKDVEMPGKWRGKYDVKFNGSADENPLASFSRGFFNEQESVRNYVELSQAYFKAGSTVTTAGYCGALQQSCIDAIPYWLRSMNYRQNALDNPALNPAA